jgi:flagellar biogenesis protein FliO
VLDVRGEQFLIGVTSQQISLLHHFDEAPIKPTVSAKPSEFAEKLQSIISKQSSTGSE